MNLEDLYMSVQRGNLEDHDILIVSCTNKARALIDKLKIDGEAKETKLFNFIERLMLLLNENSSFIDFKQKLCIYYELVMKHDNNINDIDYMLFDSYDSFEQRINNIIYIEELVEYTKYLKSFQKEIVYQMLFKNYTLEEIAAIQKTSLHNIKTDYSKAIRRMRNTAIEMDCIDKYKNR